MLCTKIEGSAISSDSRDYGSGKEKQMDYSNVNEDARKRAYTVGESPVRRILYGR